MSADPHRGLLRALTAMLPGLVVESSCREDWASNTYTGERHVIACSVAACTRAAIERIGEVEFRIPGHLVADIVVASIEPMGDRLSLTIEALTLEDW